MKKFKFAVIITLIVIGAIIVLQNMERVQTHILWYTFEMSRALLLLVTCLVGYLLGLVTFLCMRKKD